MFLFFPLSMKKWFTLIEMLLVLVLIGIITTMTMKFWSKRIQQLRYQSSKSIFVNTYEQLRSSLLSSRFYNTGEIQKFTLQLQSWSGQLNYFYSLKNGGTIYQHTPIDPDITIQNIHLFNSDKILNSVAIIMHPYMLNCNFEHSNSPKWTLSFELSIKNHKKRYCFIIPSSSCKIIEQKCDDNNNNIFISSVSNAK